MQRFCVSIVIIIGIGQPQRSCLGEGIRMPPSNSSVLRCSLPGRITPVFIQSVSPSRGWSPGSSLFVVSVWSSSGDTRAPSVTSSVWLMCLAQNPSFSHVACYVDDFCPLSLSLSLPLPLPSPPLLPPSIFPLCSPSLTFQMFVHDLECL